MDFAGGQEGQKAVLDSLELELLVVLSCLSYVLGTKLRSSVCNLNYWAISLQLHFTVLKEEKQVNKTINICWFSQSHYNLQNALSYSMK